MIRGLAALAVMWGHVRILFFLDYPSVNHPGLLTKGFYAITGLGHQAVMIFFVLSGFFISLAVFKRFANGEWSWRQYALDRMVRLYIVLIPGLILGAVWDHLGKTLFMSTGLYTEPLHNFGNLIVSQSSTPLNFVGNLLFLQTIWVKSFGSNGPLWSLTNEFWYYVLFPPLLLLVVARARLRTSVADAALIVAVAVLIGPGRMQGFLIWLSGTAVVLILGWFPPRRSLLRGAGTAIAGCLFVSFMCLSRTRTNLSLSDMAVGLSFAAFLLGILNLRKSEVSSWYCKLTRSVAGFSFSLYVLHFPLLLFLRAFLIENRRWQPDFRHLFFGLLIGGVAILYSLLIARFTEARTAITKHWIAQHCLPVNAQ